MWLFHIFVMFSLLSMVRKPRSEGSLEDPAALGISQTLQTSAGSWKCGRTRWELWDFWWFLGTTKHSNVGMWDWIVLYHVIQCNGGFTECHKPVDIHRLLYILYYLGMIGIHKHADDWGWFGQRQRIRCWHPAMCLWSSAPITKLIRLYKDIQLFVYNLIIQYIIY